MSLARTFTLLEINTLAGGYSQLTVQADTAFSPPLAPGQYLSAALEPGAPLSHSPLINVQAADRFQVLSRTQTQSLRATQIQQACIEGNAPAPDPALPRIALISANIALACSIFAAAIWRKQYSITAFAQFDDAVPFKPAPSQILMPACPPQVIASVPLLDSWNIPSRLASPLEQHGFYHGDSGGLLELWWRGLDEKERSQLQIVGFGDNRFLRGLKEWCEPRQIPFGTAEIPQLS